MHFRIAAAVVLLAAATGFLFAAEPTGSAGFDPTVLDKSVDPCTNFYQYSCGGWLKANPIPSDQTRWGRFNELFERNRAIVHDVLEKASAQSAQRTPNEQKIGDFYAACMDEAEIEAKGLQSLQAELARIDGVKQKKDLADAIARLHRAGADVLFGIGSEQDFKDTTQVILALDAGGLGLPDRDYYFREDAKSVEIRKQYVDHIANLLRLTGEPAEKAAAHAKGIMAFETALAKASLNAVERRTPANLYHKVATAELKTLAPGFEWTSYFKAASAPKVDSLNVREPEFVKAFDAAISAADLDTLKAYMRWHLVSSMSGVLPKRFYDESFSFYNQTLRGQKQQQARWKRCSASVDNYLGEAVGQEFVKVAFGPESKARTRKIVQQVEEAMRRNIAQLDWMSEETKKQAYIKLEKLADKIGYPEKWRDYSALNVVRGDAAGNIVRARAFEFDRQLAKIGKPVDRQEWSMSPPTVNAYYEPTMNDINFPAGILQPPFFSPNRDETYNYGGIGAVIGHEITHGFDDEGRQFDERGNLRDWWTKQDNEQFDERSKCFVEQYSEYPVVDDVKLNGKLTLGENVADGGGLRLALMAALASLTEENKGNVDGYTPEQRVFLGFGQIWCANGTPQADSMQALTDPHSLPRWRVNGTVSNMAEFQKAWGCKQGAPMVREKSCKVW